MQRLSSGGEFLRPSVRPCTHTISKSKNKMQLEKADFVPVLPPGDLDQITLDVRLEPPSGELVDCVAQMVERWSLTGELSLSHAQPVADG